MNSNKAELSRCSSISTVDSLYAAQIVEKFENSQQLQTDSAQPPSMRNNLTFDNSEGIHVGDVINYFYNSSSLEVSSSVKSKPEFSTEPRKYITVIAVISLIIVASTVGGVVFLLLNKSAERDIEITTTVAATTTTVSAITTTTTKAIITTAEAPMTTELASVTQTTASLSPPTTSSGLITLPSIIALDSYRSRDEWNALPPKATRALELPIRRIIITHTGGEGCSSEDECTRMIRELQQASAHLDDIPFNFLIGNDSKVYEGRGFEHRGEHTANPDATEYDSIGICVAFIGNYEHEELSEAQLAVFEEFLGYFVDNKIIAENYTIFSRDQLVRSERPADKLNEIIRGLKGFRQLQKIYHRDEWSAESARAIQRFNHTVTWALVTGNFTPKCFNFSNCAEDVWQLQQNAFEMNLTDIPYAFMVGGEGLIFEGRGWDIKGEHTEGYDDQTIAIHIIDDNVIKPPNDSVMNAIESLLEDGLLLGKLTEDYWLNARQELGLKFRGPGYSVVRIIMLWKHWHFILKSKDSEKWRETIERGKV